MVFRNSKSKNKQGNLPISDFTGQQVLSIENIKQQLYHTEDLKEREVHIHDQTYLIVYISTIVDQEKLESKVIKPLTNMEHNDILNELYGLQ